MAPRGRGSRERRPAPARWTAGPLACPLLPPEVPSSASGSFHFFTRFSHRPCHWARPTPPCSVPFQPPVAARQSVPLPAPSHSILPRRAASFQSSGHPVLFGQPPHLSCQVTLHRQQARGCPQGIIPSLWSQPTLACLCHPSAPGHFLLQPADGSRPDIEPPILDHLVTPSAFPSLACQP